MRHRCLLIIWAGLPALMVAVVTTDAQTWRELTVAPEFRCSEYDRFHYIYLQNLEPQIVDALGGMWSPYDRTEFASLQDSDIEHVVARSEAHDSGLCAADIGTRLRFARDLDNLTLASPLLNRQKKAGQDAAEWLPEHNRCWFAGRVLAIKTKYKLTVDQAEADALEGILSGCHIEQVLWPTRP